MTISGSRLARIRGALVAFAFVIASLLSAARPAFAADPNTGPGGPILVVTSPGATFSKYYAEILRTEGLNAFAVADVATALTPTTLNNYDTVILGSVTLTGTQVTNLTNWVTAGGNLIAMKPDAQLAPLLGVTSLGTTLANRYLLVNTATSPGIGIVNQTIQYHGAASLFTLNGATAVATLYSNATTATSNPAVTLRSVGSSGGQAAMFAYDLATSIVQMRQGNPAWIGQDRDGQAPIRSDDLFYGASSADPQADWIDMSKVSIPQADEQQRLLANLVTAMTLDRKPLPRFWYFPNGKKAVVIMTGDDHGMYYGSGGGSTVTRFNQFINASPAGCSVDNWECVRGTSYLFDTSEVSATDAATLTAAGFELGVHINTGLSASDDCHNFTESSLNTIYNTQFASWTSRYPSLPAPDTMRHHCIVWGGWATAAKVELAHGVRFDTNYYYWPPGWVNNVPGHFTGSAMPMRFADTDGTIIDVFQAVTQLTDESGQEYPYTINTFLDRALGSREEYGAYTVNAHTDAPTTTASDTTIESALARGVPIVSSRQMLTWLDGRNLSSFGSMSWNGSNLNFSVTQGTGTTGLRAMLPYRSATGVLNTLVRQGSPVTFTVQMVKGIEYAMFPVTSGAYVASYLADTVAPTITARVPASGATGVPTTIPVTVTFSETMDATTISSSTFELRNASNTLVPATVSYDAATRVATLKPTAALALSGTYTVNVKGGATDPRVKDVAGNALAATSSWTFTTWATPTCNPCTIWDAGTSPAVASVNDPTGVELGVKFRADTDGFITGIRFYKGSNNTGTHIGNLWSETGTPMGSATFINETASGWQQVMFDSPIPITANTVYVASYYAPNGNYAGDSGYFANNGVDNLLLHALSDSAAGGNGLYQYGTSSTFPTNTFSATNYWVDVVFAGSAPVDNVPPNITTLRPLNTETGVSVGSSVTATFNEAMDATTINSTTVYLKNPSNVVVPATVTYSAATRTVTLSPTAPLATFTTYTATVEGGTAPRVTDSAGNALLANQSWTFTTGDATSCVGCTIWAPSATPAVLEDPESNPVQLGVKFRSDVGGYITGIRFYKSAGNTGTHVGSLWSEAGAQVASAPFQNESASGWQQVNFAQPIAIAANTTWVAAYYAPVGHYSYDAGYFLNGGTDNGVLHALSNAAAGGNGVYVYGTANSFPNQTWGGTNYWVDVVFQTNSTDLTPPTVAITSPTADPTLSVSTGTINIGGTASDNFGVNTVTWTNDRGGSGTAVGTSAWNASGIALQAGANVITVTARDAANNASTDVITVTYSGAETTAPVVTITAPTSNATHSTTTATLNVGGTATDNVGVTQVTWTNSLGGSGTATGTATWAVNGITLQNGLNTITITARDAANNVGTDVIGVTYTAPVDTTPPTVQAMSPGAGSTGVNPAAAITVVFNEAMTASTINSSTIELRNSSNSLVTSTVTFNAASNTASLTPSSTLNASSSYNVTVRGGASDPRVKDAAGNALAANFTWSFTTGTNGACSGNPIAVENCLTGNLPTEWDIVGAGDTSIQGFATEISVNRGSTIQFKIDTDATDYRLDIYRMGYYGGRGARRVTTVQPTATLPQVQDDCVTQSTTGLIDCGTWNVSASWTVPATAVSGIYFAKVVREDQGPNGGASHIVFIVRDDASTSKIVFQTSDTTWQAYNNYGGNSLYQGSPGTNPGRAYKVSYNRPFNTRATDNGQDWVFNAEYPMVRWLERNGYDVSYISGLDTHRAGALLTNHKAFISVGHDEYWSGQQRTNVENARNAGVHLAFFSGNEVFWKTRWEPSITAGNQANRTLVSYKETHANGKIDPTSEWTGTWRDGRFSPDGGRPENALTGTAFKVNFGTAGISVPAALGKMRLWRNTSIAELGATDVADLPDGMLGYEWDEVPDNGFSPAGLVKLSATTVSGVDVLQDLGSSYANGTASHALTLYKHTSGALVFGAGTVQWSWGLDDDHDRSGTPSDERVEQATVNLFADMGVQPASLRSGLFATSASTDTAAPNVTVNSPASGGVVAVNSATQVTGTAVDTAGGVVGGVEVSTDGGTTWKAANGRETWSFSWTPTALGNATIRVRAVDDSGNISAAQVVDVTVSSSAPVSCPCSLWNDAVVPAVLDDPDATAVQLGVKFRSSVAGTVSAIRFYKGPANVGSHVGSLWSAAGANMGTATFNSETASGWQTAFFTTPITIQANTTYIAAYHAPNGRYSADSGYFSSAGTPSGPLYALSDSEAGGNGVYAYGGSGTFPDQTWGSANYWVDVVFSPQAAPGDTVAPAISITTPTTAATFSTSSPTLAIGGTASDAVGVTQVTWANSAGGSGTATGTTTWSVGSVALQPGSNVITVTARDAAGNTSAKTLTVTYTVAPTDTTLPNVTITSPTTSSNFNTTSGTITIGGTASDNVAVTQVTWTNSLGGSGTATGTTNWSTGSIALTLGVNTFTITARDAAGNVRTDTLAVNLTDSTDPNVTITGPTSSSTFSAGNTNTINLSGTASDNLGVTQVSWVSSKGNSGTATGTNNWTATGVRLVNGSQTITVTARDAAGNDRTDSIIVSSTTPLDTTNPSISITGPTSSSTLTVTDSNSITLSGTASDNDTLLDVRWSTNRGGFGGTASGTTSWTASGIPLQTGSNVLTVTARDLTGRTSTDTLTVTFNPSMTFGLVAAYGFNEGSGVTVTDASGNNNLGNLTNTTWNTSGRFGNSLTFNGTSSRMFVNPSNSLNIVSGITLMAWVYPQANQTGDRMIIRKEGGNWRLNSDQTGATLRPSGGARAGGADVTVNSIGTSLTLNTWNHVAVTYDGDTAVLYVNGSPVATNGNWSGLIDSGGLPVWIGGSTENNQHFQGRIDEVRIYNRALSQTEIGTIRNTAITP